MSSYLIALVTAHTTPQPMDDALLRIGIHGMTETVYEHDMSEADPNGLLLLGRVVQLETHLPLRDVVECTAAATRELADAPSGHRELLVLVVAERDLHGDWVAVTPDVHGPLTEFAFSMLRSLDRDDINFSCLV